MYRVMPPGAKDGEEGGAEERGPNETNYVEWMKVVRATDTSSGAPRLNCESTRQSFDSFLHVIGVQDHPRPCVSLQKSPFFSDMYMTVGDWNFRLWKVDNETPIFTSPNASTYITVVRARRHLLLDSCGLCVLMLRNRVVVCAGPMVGDASRAAAHRQGGRLP